MAYIYMTQHYPGDHVGLPIYKIKGNFIHRTHHHPDGYMAAPVMEIRSTSIHMTLYYPAKFISEPIYEIKDTSIYMTQQHPDTFVALDVMQIKRPVSSELRGLTLISVAPKASEVSESQAEAPDMERDLGFDERQL
jgi:hypothetical protein